MNEQREGVELPTRNVEARADGTVRFQDGRGRAWIVREEECPAPWGRAERCLIFMSEYLVRRVWAVPENWRSLSARELEALSWRT